MLPQWGVLPLSAQVLLHVKPNKAGAEHVESQPLSQECHGSVAALAGAVQSAVISFLSPSTRHGKLGLPDLPCHPTLAVPARHEK